MTTIDASAIRALNDRFRTQTDLTLGRWVVTRGVNDKGLVFVQRVCRAVREFTQFDKGNDPHEEHDGATFQVDNENLFFKIDYYADDTLQHGSEDPSDPKQSYRVMTIMLASEY